MLSFMAFLYCIPYKGDCDRQELVKKKKAGNRSFNFAISFSMIVADDWDGRQFNASSQSFISSSKYNDIGRNLFAYSLLQASLYLLQFSF